MTAQPAKIYIRRNGSFGASCDGCADTGHHIIKGTRDFFTVHSIHDPNRVICRNAPRDQAEAAITADWRTRRPGRLMMMNADISTSNQSTAMSTWPTHADGTDKTVGEMTAEERRRVLAEGSARSRAEVRGMLCHCGSVLSAVTFECVRGKHCTAN